MDHDTLIAVFVVIAAVAIVIQMAVLLGFFLIALRIRKQVSEIARDARQYMDRVAAAALEIVTGSRAPIKEVTANVAETSRIVRERASRLDEAVGDFTEKTRQQVDRIDSLVSSLVDRVDGTANSVQRNILGPLQEAGAIFRGIQTGLDFLFSHRQSAAAREAKHDGEMFI
ncbi:MAG: hypothetical protein ACRD2B_11590 [Terriglobia bacterium]